MKSYVVVFSFLLSFSCAYAQEKVVQQTNDSDKKSVTGEISLQGGVGGANPWGASTNLRIQTGALTISPFFKIKGHNRNSSEQDEEAEYRYSGISPLSESEDLLYQSEKHTHSNGLDLEYGVTAAYRLRAWDLITASVKGDYEHLNTSGTQSEKLFMPLNYPLSKPSSRFPHSVVNSDLDSKTGTNELKVKADYTHIFTAPNFFFLGSILYVSYAYEREKENEEHNQTVTSSASYFSIKRNYIEANALTQKHHVQAEWHAPSLWLLPVHFGSFYEQRTIRSNDYQWWDMNQLLDDEFHHKYQTVGTFLQSTLNLGFFKANAKLEYDYTRMQEKNYHDFIPTAGVEFNLGSSSLTLDYARRIVRPTLAYLNPAEFVDAYTQRYGNPNLVGIHLNNLNLNYMLKTKKFDFSTSVQHIFSNDGFNGIWMEKGLRRFYTWGNEGVRRAWLITPSMEWRPMEKTTLKGSATVSWDKREARAIHMAYEHWGITASARLIQQLPWQLRLQAYGEYSEGNTLDLYSHEGRHWTYGGELQRKLTNNGKLMATLAFAHVETPLIVLAQGAWTGSLYNRAHRQNQGMLTLTYKL